MTARIIGEKKVGPIYNRDKSRQNEMRVTDTHINTQIHAHAERDVLCKKSFFPLTQSVFYNLNDPSLTGKCNAMDRLLISSKDTLGARTIWAGWITVLKRKQGCKQ